MSSAAVTALSSSRVCCSARPASFAWCPWSIRPCNVNISSYSLVVCLLHLLDENDKASLLVGEHPDGRPGHLFQAWILHLRLLPAVSQLSWISCQLRQDQETTRQRGGNKKATRRQQGGNKKATKRQQGEQKVKSLDRPTPLAPRCIS